MRRRTHTRQRLLQVLAAVLALTPGGSVWAHIGDRVYPIIEISDEQIGMIDLHDGFVDEWLDVIGPPTLTGLDFIGRLGAEYQPHDLDFRIWIGWNRNSNRVYVAGQFVDDMYVNEFPHNWYDRFNQHDSMAIWIDGDHSGGGRFESNSRNGQRVRGDIPCPYGSHGQYASCHYGFCRGQCFAPVVGGSPPLQRWRRWCGRREPDRLGCRVLRHPV